MDDRALVRFALEARKNSYAPYSHFCVGAALLGVSGTVYSGCNVENASYGATICAERTAVVQAVAHGERSFTAIAIAGAPEGESAEACDYSWPCGVCRQVLREFSEGELRVLVARSEDDFVVNTLSGLLPYSFGPEHLSS